MEQLTLALWAFNMATAGPPERFVEKLDERVRAAATEGARVVVLPEWIAEAWLPFAGRAMDGPDEVAWMAEAGAAVLPAAREIAARYKVLLCPGTWSARTERGWVNRAHLCLPDGRLVTYDKLVLTPTERDPLDWCCTPGQEIVLVEWEGLRLAVLICLDIEMPALAARLQGLDLDIVLVPSMTGRRSGYHRVFGCAKARAVELFTTVAAVGCLGTVPLDPPRPYHSGAAVFVPCEEAFGSTGVHTQIPAADVAEGFGPLMLARDVPVGEIRRRRRAGAPDGAEVWPGPWPAEHPVRRG